MSNPSASSVRRESPAPDQVKGGRSARLPRTPGEGVRDVDHGDDEPDHENGGESSECMVPPITAVSGPGSLRAANAARNSSRGLSETATSKIYRVFRAPVQIGELSRSRHDERAALSGTSRSGGRGVALGQHKVRAQPAEQHLREPQPTRGCGGSSVSRRAEDARFELARGCPQHAFQACALGH